MTNILVGDTFAVRLSAVSRQRDGYVNNALGGDAFQSVDTQAVRASFAWRDDDGASLDLIANFQRDRPTGTAFKSLALDQTGPATGAVLSDRRIARCGGAGSRRRFPARPLWRGPRGLGRDAAGVAAAR